jgi:hypothetical protein
MRYLSQVDDHPPGADAHEFLDFALQPVRIRPVQNFSLGDDNDDPIFFAGVKVHLDTSFPGRLKPPESLIPKPCFPFTEGRRAGCNKIFLRSEIKKAGFPAFKLQAKAGFQETA